MGWGKNGTPSTLTSSVDVITISDLTAKKFNQFLNHNIATGGATEVLETFNSNNNTVYAFRYSTNGTADSTFLTQAFWDTNPASSATTDFLVQYICSISGEEKLMIGFLVLQSTAGAGTAPNRIESVGKFVPSPNVNITRIDMTDTSVGQWTTGSNLSALGTD